VQIFLAEIYMAPMCSLMVLNLLQNHRFYWFLPESMYNDNNNNNKNIMLLSLSCDSRRSYETLFLHLTPFYFYSIRRQCAYHCFNVHNPERNNNCCFLIIDHNIRVWLLYFSANTRKRDTILYMLCYSLYVFHNFLITL